jgi:hypothetical protein
MILAYLVFAAAAAGPEGVAAVHGVRGAWPIVLGAPFQYTWTATPQLVNEATLLIVDADPEWLRLRQTDAPVLFVGAAPAERLNVGVECGCAIVLVPGVVDPATTPIYFGSATLAERVDAAAGARELAAAVAEGARGFAAPVAPQATFTDPSALYRTLLSELVLEHAPAEQMLAVAWRAPRVGR